MSLWRNGLSWLLLAACAGGCSARFTDERPESERPDLRTQDLRGIADLTGAPMADPDLATAAATVATGIFVGRAGHGGKGSAELYRRGDGVVELRFGADFQVTGVVGPFVYLTSRGDMGGSVDINTDVELGALKMTQGAQSYELPAGADGGRRNAFVWCKPFKVEIAKAVLVDIP